MLKFNKVLLASDFDNTLVYFSKKRENVLVYLSNAVEKYCRDTGFVHTGQWEKWGPYGFDLDGVQRLEEYYPNALEETYAGVSGYIYGAEPANTAPVSDVPFAVTSEEAAAVVSCEFVPDAYEAILRAEREGLLRILHYAQTGDPFRAWQNRQVDFDFLRCKACALRHRRAEGADELR